MACPVPLDAFGPYFPRLVPPESDSDFVAVRRVEQSQNRRLEESYAMCAPFLVMRSTQEQANLRWRLKTGGAVAIHSP